MDPLLVIPTEVEGSHGIPVSNSKQYDSDSNLSFCEVAEPVFFDLIRKARFP